MIKLDDLKPSDDNQVRAGLDKASPKFESGDVSALREGLDLDSPNAGFRTLAP